MWVDGLNVWSNTGYARAAGDATAAPGAQKKPDAPATAAPAAAVPPPSSPDPGAGKATSAGADTANMGEEKSEKSLLERILERGFTQFVTDLEKEKLAKMREEILGAMGLTEEDLAKMPPDQRKRIEDMIAQEIRQRLEAASTMNPGDAPRKGEGAVSGGRLATGAAGGGGFGAEGAAKPGSQTGHETGLGVLLALQEIDAAKAEHAGDDQAARPGKKGPPEA